MRKKPILLRLLPWIIAAVVIIAFVIVLDMIYSNTSKSFARDTKIISFSGDGMPAHSAGAASPRRLFSQ